MINYIFSTLPLDVENIVFHTWKFLLHGLQVAKKKEETVLGLPSGASRLTFVNRHVHRVYNANFKKKQPM